MTAPSPKSKRSLASIGPRWGGQVAGAHLGTGLKHGDHLHRGSRTQQRPFQQSRNRRRRSRTILVVVRIVQPGWPPWKVPLQTTKIGATRDWEGNLQAVGVVFWAQLRHRWRSWLAIVILISLVGGVVLATVAAGRRTDSAFPRFVAGRGFDAQIYSAHSPQRKVSTLPGVSEVTRASGPYNGQPACACTHPLNASGFGVLVLPQHSRSIFTLVSGRLPSPSNPQEVLASYTLRKDEGIHLGSIIRVPFYSPSQASAYSNATGPPPKPTGPTVAFRVVGFEATEIDFPYGAAPNYLIFASQAFAREVMPRTITGYAYFVRLRHGAADLPDSMPQPVHWARRCLPRMWIPWSIRLKLRFVPRPSDGGCCLSSPRWSAWPSSDKP